jgi:hypothetical protein
MTEVVEKSVKHLGQQDAAFILKDRNSAVFLHILSYKRMMAIQTHTWLLS